MEFKGIPGQLGALVEGHEVTLAELLPAVQAEMIADGWDSMAAELATVPRSGIAARVYYSDALGFTLPEHPEGRPVTVVNVNWSPDMELASQNAWTPENTDLTNAEVDAAEAAAMAARREA